MWGHYTYLKVCFRPSQRFLSLAQLHTVYIVAYRIHTVPSGLMSRDVRRHGPLTIMCPNAIRPLGTVCN